MIALFRIFWADRSAREQQLLTVMFALLIPCVLWLALFRPLASALVVARDRLDHATVEAGQVSARVNAVHLAVKTPVPALGGTLVALVGTSTQEVGFTPSRLDPQGIDRVQIAIPSAKSPVFFRWLDTLSRRGIFAERMTLRPNSDATLNCEATLRVRRL